LDPRVKRSHAQLVVRLSRVTVTLAIGGQPFVIAGEAVRAELDEKLIEEIEEAVLVGLVSG